VIEADDFVRRWIGLSTNKTCRVIVIDMGPPVNTTGSLRAWRHRFRLPRVTLSGLTKATAQSRGPQVSGSKHARRRNDFVGMDADTRLRATLCPPVHNVSHENTRPSPATPRVATVSPLDPRSLSNTSQPEFRRRALDLLGAIQRGTGRDRPMARLAVRGVGGYPSIPAEDADLTMSLLERGTRVEYEYRVAGLQSEAPTTRHASFATFPLVVRNLQAFALASRVHGPSGCAGLGCAAE